MRCDGMVSVAKRSIKPVPVQLTGVAALLKPTVYKAGHKYRCLTGDPECGVMGEGPTAERAVQAWESELQKRLAKGDDDDYVVQYVKQILEAQRKLDLPADTKPGLRKYLTETIRPRKR